MKLAVQFWFIYPIPPSYIPILKVVTQVRNEDKTGQHLVRKNSCIKRFSLQDFCYLSNNCFSVGEGRVA